MNKNINQILIVCRGNILRSPFAEIIIKRKLYKENLQDEFVVFSRGIHGTIVDSRPVKFPNITFYKDIYKLAKNSLAKYLVDLSHRTSKTINTTDILSSSVVFAMDDKILNSLCKLFPEDVIKFHKLSEIIDEKDDFLDPETLTDSSKYEKVFTEIYEAIQKGFPKLIALAKGDKKL